MDMIQQLMLLLRELIIRFREIFSFVNNQFLPVTDNEKPDMEDHGPHHKH